MKRSLRPRLGRVTVAACSIVGMSATALLVMGSPASAAPAPVCSGGAVNTCTVTFSTPGVGQSWVVPTGVTSESFDLFGATGALTGGDGARVTGTLSLAAGTSVTVDVGGAGSGGTGGANGGGNAFFGGGGGGGASDIQLAGADQLVAGGGGGGGFGTANQTCGSPASPAAGAGGNADTTGGNGGAVTVPFVVTLTLNGGGGGGAGTSAGGVAGLGGTVSPPAPFDLCPPGLSPVSPGGSGAPGTSGQGGGGNGSGGGGGGGGFFGGGQGGGGAFDSANNGGASGGGGGGSSFGITGSNFAVSDTGNDGSVNAGNGQVVITYIVSAATTPTTTPTTTPGAGTGTASTTGGADGDEVARSGGHRPRCAPVARCGDRSHRGRRRTGRSHVAPTKEDSSVALAPSLVGSSAHGACMPVGRAHVASSVQLMTSGP